jgi:hypothetical protein
MMARLSAKGEWGGHKGMTVEKVGFMESRGSRGDLETSETDHAVQTI